MLEHEWFAMEDNYKYKMSEMEYKLHELREQTQQIDNYHVDMTYLGEEKANLIGQSQGNRNPVGTYRDIDRLKEHKRNTYGLINY